MDSFNYVKGFDLFGIKTKQIPCLTAKGEPSNELALKIGLLYIDEDNGDMYKCIKGNGEESLVWVKIDNQSNDSGQNLSLDTTLTQSGKAADAKAVGDALDKLEEKIPTKPEDIGAQPKGNYLTSAPVTSVNGKTGAVQLSAEQVGADPKGTATAAVSAHNTNNAAHSDIRQEIKAIREQLAAFLDVDEETLNELSELIARIVANQTSIEQLTTGKVNVADIIDNLTTNVANKPLSAAQGVAIKTLIDGLSASLANYQPKGDYALTSAVPTKVSQLQNDSKYLTAVTAAMITAALGYTPINPGLATLARHTDGLLYLFVNGKPVGSGVELPTGGIDGYITEDKQIIFSNLPDGEYSLAYLKEDGTISAPIGSMVKDTNVYYTVTKNLTNCTISNSATQVIEGESYAATITAKSGYELKTVTVTMGGSPVSVSGGKINIANVTGNIVITAVAEEVQTGQTYTNILTSGKYSIEKNKRWSGSGKSYVDCAGMIALTIPIADALNKTIYLGGFTNGLAPQSKTAIWMYTKSDNSQATTFLDGGTGNIWDSSYLVTNGDKLYSVPINADTGATTSGVSYLVINLGVSTSAITTIPDTFIITIDEPIA